MKESRQREQRRFIWTLVLVAFGAQTLIVLALFWWSEAGTIGAWVQILSSAPFVVLVGYLGVRMFASLSRRLEQEEARRVEALGLIEYLEVHNALLRTIASDPDTTRAFITFARRIVDVVPCDRVGLALLKAGGDRFATYSARVGEQERRKRPRPEADMPVRGTLIGSVISSPAPRLVNDVAGATADYLDANALRNSGIGSVIVVPLVFEGTVIGALTLASRQRDAFTPAHVQALLPVAEIVAMAFLASRNEGAPARPRAAQALARMTFADMNDIGSAVRAILAQCAALTGENGAAPRVGAAIDEQARRITGVLERLQVVADERLRAETRGELMTVRPPEPGE